MELSFLSLLLANVLVQWRVIRQIVDHPAYLNSDLGDGCINMFIPFEIRVYVYAKILSYVLETCVRRSSVGEITVLCHFRNNDLMTVIICKNDKHLITLYNVIFSNMTGILLHLSYILYEHKRATMCHWKEMYWENYISDQMNTETVFL